MPSKMWKLIIPLRDLRLSVNESFMRFPMSVGALSSQGEPRGKQARLRRFHHFKGLTICVGFSAQVSRRVLWLLGWPGLLHYSGTHVAVCGDRTCRSRAL